jgi:hypothetical protein
MSLVLEHAAVPCVYVIVAVPGVTPVTSPVDGFTLTLPLLLLHAPPNGVLDRVTVEFLHTASGPVGTVGNAYTVTATVWRQPVLNVYDISTVLVPLTPVTTPVPTPTVAIAVLPLAQVPPGVKSVNVVVPPASHTWPVPVIGSGSGFTVAVAVL